jgi:hypothetical protein
VHRRPTLDHEATYAAPVQVAGQVGHPHRVTRVDDLAQPTEALVEGRGDAAAGVDQLPAAVVGEEAL